MSESSITLKLQKVEDILSKSKKVLVTAHKKPDPDAVGSSLGMFSYVRKMFPAKKVDVVLQGNSTDKWNYLELSTHIKWVEDISSVVSEYDTLVLLDGNSRARFSESPESIDLSKFKTVVMDHHPNEPELFDVDLSDNTAASATQLVYKYFFREKPELLDESIAKALLIGIIGDTGTFRYVNHKNVEVLELAGEIISAAKLDVQSLELYISQFEKGEFELLKQMIVNTRNVELPGKPPFTCSFLPMSVLENFTLESISRITGIYKFQILRQVKDHNWGFIVTPAGEGEMYISFRSTPGYPNVRNLAVQFGGGGHLLAAGGHYYMQPGEEVDCNDVLEKVIGVIKNTKLETVIV